MGHLASMSEKHKKNSPITQTIPEPTLSWGGWPCEKLFPTPGHTASPVLSYLLGHLDPIVLKPFDIWDFYLMKEWALCLNGLNLT